MNDVVDEAKEKKNMMPKQESLDEAFVRVQRTFCIPSKAKKVEATIPSQEARPKPEVAIEKPKAIKQPEKAQQKEEPKKVEEPEEGDIPKCRQYPKETLERQKKLRDGINKNPEKYGVSKERVRLVGKLADIIDHPEKYGSKAEQKRAEDRIVGRLMGKKAQVKEDGSSEEEEG